MNNISPTLIRLAKLNGMEEILKKQEILREIRPEMSVNDELAILRKAVAYLFEIIELLHTGEISNEEFKAHHEYIERIKAAVKSKIDEG